MAEKTEQESSMEMKSARGSIKDMTSGNILRIIIGFAIPMFMGMLFQQFYSMVDTIIVGKFLGVNQLAGVGSTGSLNFFVIGFCVGVCNGFAIPVAQAFGAKREGEVRCYTANGAWLAAGFAAVITVTVAALCRTILTAMKTPAEILDYANDYFFVIALGIPFTFLYNILAALTRALGDSKSPVYFLAISSVLNIVLDLLFIVVFQMGVVGAAAATVIAQAVSGGICLMYMKRKFPILKMTAEERRPQPKYFGRLCLMGIPMGLQYSITAIGSLIVQIAINGLGPLYVAAVTAGSRLNNLVSCPVEAVGQTMSPFSGQNAGAGKTDRITRGLVSASLVGFAMSGICFVLMYFFGKNLSLFFLEADEVDALQYSYQFLMYSVSGYCLLTLVNTVRFTIQGMGYSVLAITSGILEMIARALAGIILVQKLGFIGICIANPLAWIFADLFLIPAFLICRKRFIRVHGC